MALHAGWGIGRPGDDFGAVPLDVFEGVDYSHGDLILQHDARVLGLVCDGMEDPVLAVVPDRHPWRYEDVFIWEIDCAGWVVRFWWPQRRAQREDLVWDTGEQSVMLVAFFAGFHCGARSRRAGLGGSRAAWLRIVRAIRL